MTNRPSGRGFGVKPIHVSNISSNRINPWGGGGNKMAGAAAIAQDNRNMASQKKFILQPVKPQHQAPKQPRGGYNPQVRQPEAPPQQKQISHKMLSYKDIMSDVKDSIASCFEVPTGDALSELIINNRAVVMSIPGGIAQFLVDIMKTCFEDCIPNDATRSTLADVFVKLGENQVITEDDFCNAAVEYAKRFEENITDYPRMAVFTIELANCILKDKGLVMATIERMHHITLQPVDTQFTDPNLKNQIGLALCNFVTEEIDNHEKKDLQEMLKKPNTMIRWFEFQTPEEAKHFLKNPVHLQMAGYA